MTNFEYLRNRLHQRAGLIEPPKPKYKLSDLEKSEWCPLFEQLMRNRMIMGAFRYGLLNDPNKGKYDCIGSIIKRAELYRKTGNQEHLVDIANISLVEFVRGEHPLKHFHSTDDGHHARRILK